MTNFPSGTACWRDASESPTRLDLRFNRTTSSDVHILGETTRRGIRRWIPFVRNNLQAWTPTTFCRFQYLPAQVLQLCHRTHQNPSKKRTFCACFHLRLKLPRISALFCNCLSCYVTSARSCARDDEDFAINTRQLFLEGWRGSWGLVPGTLQTNIAGFDRSSAKG